jgi:hypothetical protein
MSFLRTAILFISGLASTLAFAQRAEVFNPAEPTSTTLYGPVPIQQDPSRITATLLDTRSGLITGVGTGAGGADLSTLQSSSLLMTSFGSTNSTATAFRVAENFVVPAGGWTIDKITTYAYQTGSTTTSTMNAFNFRIWNGTPGAMGSSVVFGDTTTNRMTATAFTNIYRVTETTLTATNRPIMAIEAGGLNLTLPAGTYWLDWQVGGSLGSGPFAPPLTTLGQTITGDAIQFDGTTWNSIVDANVAGSFQGLPLTITGVTAAGITVTQSGGSTDVTEGGATDSFTVVLTSAPSADVVIALTPDAQVSVAPASLTFTPANWNVPQVVTVTAVDDAVVEGAHSGLIAFAVTSADLGYNGLAVASITVNVTDNDIAGVTVTQSGGSTNVTEGGATDSFTVVLTSQPSANVTVALATGTQITLSSTSLTFTPANWNVAQTVTVTAVDDAVVEGAHGDTISFTVTSADANYSGLSITSVTVNITDNDAAGITVVQSGGTTIVSESGVADTLSVVLNSQPTANVTVTLSGGSQLGVSPTVLVFTPANWNVPQVVTVSAIDDAVVEGPHNGLVSFAVTSADSAYNGLAVAGITVAIVDNDFAAPVSVPTLGSPAVLAMLLLLVAAAGFALRRQVRRA